MSSILAAGATTENAPFGGVFLLPAAGHENSLQAASMPNALSPPVTRLDISRKARNIVQIPVGGAKSGLR